MSYLIIGNDLVSLYYAKLLKDLGWKVTLITKGKFSYGAEYCLVDDILLERLGLKYRLGQIKHITSVEVVDIYKKSRIFETDTKLVDLGIYKNQLFGAIRKNIEYYEDAVFIDKHDENVFLKVANRGILHKAKYVLNFEDIELSNKIGNIIQQKDHLFATVKRSNPKSSLTIFFFETGYGWISNFTQELAHVSMFGDNLDLEFDKLIADYDLVLVNKYAEKIPVFNQNLVPQKESVYLGGQALGLVNNLNLDYISPRLEFCAEFKTYYHKLMTNSSEDYEKKVNTFITDLKEYNKYAKVFWDAKDVERNHLISYYNPRFGVLDFKSIFKNLPKLSKHRFKLLFS